MSRLTSLTIVLLAGLLLQAFSAEVLAQGSAQATFTTYKDLGSFVRVKGQESNDLQGIGLVVGLKGTGDTNLTPTHKALALLIKNSGKKARACQQKKIKLRSGLQNLDQIWKTTIQRVQDHIFLFQIS